jgi:hypothetical protein
MRDNPPAGVDLYRPEKSFEVQFAESRLKYVYFKHFRDSVRSHPFFHVLLGPDVAEVTTKKKSLDNENRKMREALRRLPQGYADNTYECRKGEMGLLAWRLRCEQNRVTALFHQKEILRLQENRMLTRRGEAARIRKRKKVCLACSMMCFMFEFDPPVPFHAGSGESTA